jgi:hypothetical protein
MDLNGTELVLDADADTSITADTDDQIDIKISGADDFRFTANNFNILSGSTITIDSGATITNSGTATGFSSGPSQATQSAIEAETNEDTYIPPDLVRNSPGVAKVLASVTGTGDSYIQSYNLDGITDTATGIRTHTITTDFAANTYQVIGGSRQHSGTRTIYHTLAAGSFIERVQDPDTAADSDLPTSIAAFGAQV